MPSSGDEQGLDGKLPWEGDHAELCVYFLQLFWAWEWRSDWPGRSNVASKHTGAMAGLGRSSGTEEMQLRKGNFKRKNEMG